MINLLLLNYPSPIICRSDDLRFYCTVSFYFQHPRIDRHDNRACGHQRRTHGGCSSMVERQLPKLQTYFSEFDSM